MAAKGTAVAKAKINLPTDVNASMAAEVAEIQKRISAPSGDRITATQSKTFKLSNGLEVDEFEAIVVDFAAANYYYTEAFDRDNIVPPACFSISLEPAGMVPSVSVLEPQGGACASCWANQWKSSGKGKACQNTRLLAILPTDADSETGLSVLKISPTAVKAFDGLVANTARIHNMPIRAIKVKFFFNREEEYATIRFTDAGLAPKDLVLLANSRKAEALERLLVEPNVTAANDNVGNQKPSGRGKTVSKPAPRGKTSGSGARA